jgi:hypothetical protein
MSLPGSIFLANGSRLARLHPGGAGRFDGGSAELSGRVGRSRKITRIMSNLSAPLHPGRLDAVEKRPCTIGNGLGPIESQEKLAIGRETAEQ